MKQLGCLCPRGMSTWPAAGRCGLALPILSDQPKATRRWYPAVLLLPPATQPAVSLKPPGDSTKRGEAGA